MRRPPPALLSICLSLPLVLAGCAGSGASGNAGAAASSASSARASTAASSQPAGLPVVQGAAGSKPTVKAPATAPGPNLVTEVLSEGNGPEVGKGDLLVANYLGQTWREDKTFDNSYDRGSPVAFPIGVGKVIEGWDEGLVGRKAGSRLLLVIPPEKGYGSQGQPQAGIEPDDTLVFVVDVVASYPPDAGVTGPAQPSPAGLPTITSATSAGRLGRPEVSVPAGAKPPKKLRSVVLVKGSGPPVAKGQLLVAQYTGLTWAGGKEFDSSWKRGEPAGFPIGVGEVIPGWDQALVGVPAGSRVLLVVPPEQGYGKAGQPAAGIKGDDTLVFVVDVLGAH